MEYLRNLPSKTNAFSNATYERVRGSNAHSRPYFTTKDQTPNQILPASSDENLILAAIRQKKQPQMTAAQQEPSKRPSTPEAGVATDLGNTPPPSQPRLFKRPRIALSNQAANVATGAAAAATSADATGSTSNRPPSSFSTTPFSST